jgi:hypothetical protein
LETVERGLRGHVDTEQVLVAALRERGIEPWSPRAREPNFDVAWQHGEDLFVAEVKSTTAANEERQLRLGLGQVLRYRALLAARASRRVHAVLVPEREPADRSWRRTCAEVDVTLIPHGALGSGLDELLAS